MTIHPTAVIASGAELGVNVEIAPYAVIEENVTIGDGCYIGPHVHLSGYTTIGKNTEIHAGAVIGDKPQDLHYSNEKSYTEIGDNCILREYTTIHRGSSEESKTVVGNHVMLMAFAHLGHNCIVGDEVVIANNTMVGGHVEVGSRAFISASCLVHQFVRVGRVAMVGGGNKFAQDVPPFCMFQFDEIQGPNVVGLKRAGITPADRKALRSAIKIYFFSGLNRANAVDEILANHGDVPEVKEFADFVNTTQKGILPGRQTKTRHGSTNE